MKIGTSCCQRLIERGHGRGCLMKFKKRVSEQNLLVEYAADLDGVIEGLSEGDLDGDIEGFRFSNQLMQAIDPNHPDAVAFYRAYHELCCRVADPQVRATFRLCGGEILIVAAHRVLHGRKAFEPTGRRHLQDAYFELDHVQNHLVVLQRKGAS